MVEEETESEESVEDAPKGVPSQIQYRNQLGQAIPLAQVASADADKVGRVEDEEEIFEDNLIEDEVSDFSISDMILSVAPTAHVKHNSNLENLAGEEEYEESQWNKSGEVDEDEDEKKNFYDESSKDLYSKNQDDSDSTQTERHVSDLYNEKHEGLYSAGDSKDGVYDSGKKHTKGYGEFVEGRRSGRSMLEIAGFEDKEKQKNRDMHGLIKYDAETN